jgi:MFS family permease
VTGPGAGRPAEGPGAGQGAADPRAAERRGDAAHADSPGGGQARADTLPPGSGAPPVVDPVAGLPAAAEAAGSAGGAAELRADDYGPAAGGSGAAGGTDVRKRTWVLACSSLGGFLVTFMTSSVNVALPLIDAEFSVSAVMLSWIALAFILVSGAALLPAGRVADLYGRVRVFLLGMVVMAVISFASALAPSAAVLLVFRALHGVGLALGAATSVAVVILAFPLESRGRALGMNVAGVYLGMALGPVLGGLIVHNLGWRSLFWVVGALGLVNVVLVLWKLRGVEWREEKTARFDLMGSVIYAAGLTAVLLGFSLLPGVAGMILVPAGVAGLVLFLWWETRAGAPLLHVDLLRRSRVFTFSNLATFVNYASTSAMIFLMSLYLQYNRGLNAQTAGFVLVCGTGVQVICSPLVGRLADRVEARHVASGGLALSVVALLGLSFLGVATPYWYIIIMLCLLGAGIALFAAPNTHAIMGSVENRWVGVAAATVATMRQAGVSMSMGVATLMLALLVGRQEIEPENYPQVLTSIRITFLIFTILCVLGVGAQLVGPRRQGEERSRGSDG